MSACGPKRTSLVAPHMSAFGVKRHRFSLALHRDHDAARRRMPLGDQWVVARIVVPILDRLLARKFDNDDAARSLAFEHFVCAGFGEITSAVPLDKRQCLLEVVGESRLVVDLVLADVKGGHLWFSGCKACFR